MKKNNVFNKVIFTLLASFLLLGTIFVGSATPAQAAKADKDKLTINVADNGGGSILSIIKEKGWLEAEFKKYNATVTWSEFPSGPPILEAFAAKRVDFTFLGDGAALQGQAAGLKFKNIALISDGKGISKILIPTDSKIKSVKDLKGKTIAVAKGTTFHVFLLKALIKNGLKESDVKLVNLQLADGLPAFVSGKVDAWVTPEPYVTQLISAKTAKLLPGLDTTIPAPSALIARSSIIKSHPELVTAFLEVYKEAIAWRDDNLEEAAQLVADKKKYPIEIIKILNNSFNYTLTPITKEAIDAQQKTVNLLYDAKFLKKKVKYSDSIDNSFINKVLK
ncbi:aliphatic sulfonate ABC transporter substrate-binding protein [Paenibacillus anaericanus]|uniref:Putative aliphatic sulfonates-binding protein n=1 Tax=Paenibacillus anaericanus TaxID=170367 RepID=A0A433YAW5_9BACL|nr:aliphatic sulfonate ABC transporter substrate-binding protein [Paenibacillus anaericanus]RUT47004.1 aliphatic sulfonate ABC transporter substrate-binding protein [Paenibacillus anaericanus]